jgi:hypothetical protein
MKSTHLRRRGRTGTIWTSPFVRALAGQFGTTGDPTVMRSLGQFVPLSAPDRPGPRVEDRTGQLLEWTRSGELTYGDAEFLLALDESTAWRR